MPTIAYQFYRFMHVRRVLVLFVLVFLFYALFLPKSPIGEFFFGRVPLLYNVTLSQFFYAQAAHPLFGKPEPYALHQLSRTYFIKGDLPKALRTAQEELAAYPSHGATHYIIGLTLGYMDREEEAIDEFSKYMIFNSKSWAARNDKAWLQFRIGDIDGGLETIEPIVWATDNPWIQNTYGVLLMNKGRYGEAEIAFRNAEVVVSTMTTESWGRSYPGNDPRIYAIGLHAMRESIAKNIRLSVEKQRQ